jgi:hypothetical protein
MSIFSRYHHDTYMTILTAPCEHIKPYRNNNNFRRVRSITEHTSCYPGRGRVVTVFRCCLSAWRQSVLRVPPGNITLPFPSVRPPLERTRDFRATSCHTDARL